MACAARKSDEEKKAEEEKKVFGGGESKLKAKSAPPEGDTTEVYGGRAGRQAVQRVLGADKSSPHSPDWGFTAIDPARKACPLSLPTLNGLVEKESHKLADEQRREGEAESPPSPPLLSHAISFFPLPSSGFHLTKPLSP
ncbi:liprin-alpha-3-like protein [Lates japonicus]|uniref:Liprin-alpha-3-like protein n=1 Tax=Lates japonicus TaxID=270547 RepID=A0AAD3M795_LATJO|nr:liprin-alpha-3-like protein [Lates japonicus]